MYEYKKTLAPHSTFVLYCTKVMPQDVTFKSFGAISRLHTVESEGVNIVVFVCHEIRRQFRR